ncbi:DUF4925 domain-containing protein [Bacteroides sp.]|uniref:DUF4925 domain-containing protein n=1 Tax=Bacteroides sp. TaxID=29523 RepID=UPI003AB1753F
MKKNLFYLFALICSVSLFTACSSDDDPNWKQIPTTPIEGADATFTVNGNSATGTVKFTPQSATQGQVELNNVFPGYSTVIVDVMMEEQADGSFNFSGEKGLSNPSMGLTRSTDVAPAIMNVTVKGNVTLAGKASVTATSALTETAMGGLAGSWNLLGKIDTDQYVSVINSSPFFLRWVPLDEKALSGAQTSTVGSLLVSKILAEVLNQVTFHTDGNITAKFYSELPFDAETAQAWIMGNIFTPDINVSHTDWNTSPKNMAFWYVRDSKLYIVPNIAAIMKQVSGGEAGDLDMAAILQMLSQLGIDVTKLDPALIGQITSWLSTGIPLNYKTTDAGILEVYVDKAMVEPFMPVLFAMLPGLQAQLDEMAATNPLVGLLPLLLGVPKLTDYETIWKDNTATFDLGLGFTK